MNRKHLLCLLLVTVLLCCGAFGPRVESSAETLAPSATPAVTDALISEESPADAPARRTIRIFETSDIHGYLLDTPAEKRLSFSIGLPISPRL